MKTFYLDLETTPRTDLIYLFISRIKAPKTYKDPVKIADYIEKKKEEMTKGMSVDVDFCEIKCIGLKVDDEPAKIVSFQELIDLFAEEINSHYEEFEEFSRKHFFRVVTFNGKKFDLPILLREGARQGLTGIKYRPVMRAIHYWTKRFDTSYHVDLYELLGEAKSLDMYSQIYLDWPKEECDFETCTQEELEKHCTDDVDMTAALYHKFENLLM